MSFRLPKRAEKYFEKIMDRGGGKADIDRLNMFDAYYYCVLSGFALCEVIENKSDTDAIPFMKQGYPDDYKDSRDYIAGLLIASEIKRRNVRQSSPTELEKLMVELVTHESSTHLSEEGLKHLDYYAFRGVEWLVETISKPETLNDFLVAFCDNLKRINW